MDAGTDRDQAVHFLNQAKLSGDANEKVSALRSVWEIVINKQPSLIEEFAPEVALLQVDPNKAVRTFVPEFLETACLQRLNIAVIEVAVGACLGLLADSTPAVVKRAILASHTIFRCGFWLLASQPSGGLEGPRLASLWQAMSTLKDRVGQLGAEHDNDGVRLNAIKFMEQLVLLYTGTTVSCPNPASPQVELSPSHALLKPTVLARDAQAVLSALIGLLKAPEVDKLSHTARLVAVKALTAIAMQRNQHMGRCLPTLLELASAAGDGDNGKQASVKAELKKGLLAMLGSQAPAAQAWSDKVEAALTALGVQASQIRKAGRKGKRDRQAGQQEDTPEADSKRAKSNGQAGRDAQQAAPDSLARDPLGGSGRAGDMQEAVKAVFLLGDMVRRADWEALHGLVESLPNPILVEVVMANMAYLPSSPALLASLDAEARQAAAADEQAPAAEPDGGPPASAGGQDDLPVKQEDGGIKEEAGPAAVAPRWTLEATELEGADVLHLKKAAFVRILKEKSRAVLGFRAPILARVATEAMLGDGVGDVLLDHILERLVAGEGLDLALKWLYALFSAEANAQGSGPPPSAASTPERPTLEGVEVEESTMVKEEAGAEEVAGRPHSTPRFDAVLMALLEGMREQLPPTNKALASVMLEAPALPVEPVFAFLHELCEEGEDWQTLALTTARSLIMVRPPVRNAALDFVLQSATSRSPPVREKAVRLVANRLLGEHGLQDRIEQYAQQQLMRITLPRPTSGVSAGDAAGIAEPGLKEEDVPSVSRGGEGQPADIKVKEEEERTDPAPTAPSRQALEEEGLSYVELYTALCTKNHALLPALFQAFAKARGPFRGSVLKNADKLAMVLGPDATALHDLVRHTPPGAENLLLKMLYSLTEKLIPSPDLVKACLDAYEERKDARLLPPALTGMSKQQVMQYFPLLLYLDPAGFKAALHRLLMPLPPSGESLFTPASILVALHTIEPSKENIADGTNRLIAAISVCMQQRDVFNADALAFTLNQLINRTPLPRLFMRFVLQSLAAAPRLRSFVLELLATLSQKQLWKNAQQWKGWLLCAEQTAPDSFPTLLKLPPKTLEDSLPLMKGGIAFVEQLAAFAVSPRCPFRPPDPTMAALNNVRQRLVAQ